MKLARKLGRCLESPIRRSVLDFLQLPDSKVKAARARVVSLGAQMFFETLVCTNAAIRVAFIIMDYHISSENIKHQRQTRHFEKKCINLVKLSHSERK